MLKRFRHMIMLSILLISAYNAGAQEMPDYVYIGSTKHYHVNPNPIEGSTYTWKIDGVEQSTTTNEIDITWNIVLPSPHILTVQEHSAAGCDGPLQTGEVYVYQVNLPDPLSECVENIQNAYYDAVKQEIIIDRPDYFIFRPEDKLLDLKPFDFTDFFPTDCQVKIRWKIERKDGTQLIPVIPALPNSYQTGQPSTYGEIRLPGDELNSVVYTITYWIVDCKGYVSYTNTQTITIKPRPFIKDNY